MKAYFNYKSVTFWMAVAEAVVNIVRAAGVEVPPQVDGIIAAVFGIGLRKAVGDQK